MHAPFLELDGALMRVRLPGGLLSTAAACAVSAIVDRTGGGIIELTNRANLQLRAIAADRAVEVRDALIAAGVADADPAADERRNVITSPTAGIDAHELVDTLPLVTAVAELLASPAGHGLSPKFVVVIDGGGAVSVGDRRGDITLGAARLGGEVVYDVRIAGATRDPATTIPPGDALRLIETVIRGNPPIGREVPRRDLAFTAAGASPVGAAAQRQSGRVWVGATVVLGRLTATALGQLADLAAAEGDGVLRFTPWRGVLIAGVAAGRGATVLSTMEDIGLIGDPTHPANAVITCAGSCGCASGLADTQTDARHLIEHLTRMPRAQRPESVHVSGCEKGCARSVAAERSLVAVGGGRYDVYVADDTDPPGRFGRRVSAGLELAAAIEAMAR